MPRAVEMLLRLMIAKGFTTTDIYKIAPPQAARGRLCRSAPRRRLIPNCNSDSARTSRIGPQCRRARGAHSIVSSFSDFDS
jgi:hypothetical protein